ncbi:MAG TPA: NADH-quinone oxidoreductase subunit NuoG [Pyrinomonadaceae bacterium]|nr:NADH-quinone oxidoreductase subunit NuoG [Pyrinomonadaceae bacterium]
MATELAKLTINGKEFEVPKGARLIDVCREKGFDIPSFCYYADLALQASCRMCLVRIEKMPKLQTSCTITVTDGMIVTTQSEEIEKAQRGMTEFLLANHPLDCPVCDRGGECELQEMTFDWGGLEERFTEQKNYAAERYLSPMVANDPQRCILCKRCTRVCDEWMGEEAIEAGGRGAHTVIGTYMGWLDCSQCGNCIEVCPTGTLLDATYRHQTRPWELAQTISTCNYCSDGCQMSIGSRSGEVRRVVARDRYVNGINGEFLCVKGRFGHPFINHEDRIRTPMIRYKKGGKLIPATWDEAIKHIAERLDAVADKHGRNAIGVVGSPRLTNESLYVLRKFATELVGTENYTTTDLYSLQPFFDNLGAPLATHRDIRYAKTIVLIGGDPSELQPLTGKQMRQAVRNGGANLILINPIPIRLREQTAIFLHVRPGTEEAVLLALAGSANNDLAAQKADVDAAQLDAARQMILGTAGDVVVMFTAELSAAAQTVLAQLSSAIGGEGRRVLLHPLPLFNNSVGAHDMRMMDRNLSPYRMLGMTGDEIKAMYVAGGFLREHFEGREDALSRLEFLVVQELFENETTAAADVVLPAASYAEVDGTFTNNAGLVQRVRQSIPPLHQSKADWMIVAQLAKELGLDWGYELSASAVFREIGEQVPAYAGMRYPLLKDESKPVQAKHAVSQETDFGAAVASLRSHVESLSADGEKITVTPDVGAELFRLGRLTEKVPQFQLLANGNPRPETTAVSPLYQITVSRAQANGHG